MASLKKLMLLSSCLTLAFNVFAINDLPPKELDQSIEKLYHTIPDISKLNMQARLDKLSSSFVGKPYILGSLGEGDKAYFDQMTLYRFDGFDCETFVTSVLALALANNPTEYKVCLQKLRYQNGKVSFITRNHFTALDWNSNNQQQGYVKDITRNFTDKNSQPVYKVAEAIVNKPSWYQHLSSKSIRLNSPEPKEVDKRLSRLKQRGSKLAVAKEQIDYLPLTALFDAQGVPNLPIFKQIPDAAIIEIVRPNWDLTQAIGTHLNVSHLGFAFWKDDHLIFRQASSNFGKVVDVPLMDYLKEALSSPTIKGINVQIVLPEKPLNAQCSAK
ncbi:N-acetylmuramoyl-L-alanine amidase-like domain-containing protein [Legionella quinlivanii]|uniref:N-acetylmuramoyl-L-alanine amidase-like domain-containing protein n=1 Tax=Legionella quinlivanii TaxID=45073 RepID=UPI002242ED39|nr:N-acetylmuramoyl-L-alanine amidase-like domain-containing protein [Legionella quinlivanii]MCW8451877.1 DUF1460 domain-containing protein [Legionella quinlivanii]